jgi:predicted CXXCH cytochrome family protein
LLTAITLVPDAQAGTSGTPHDFSDKSWSGNRVCLPCHTPHEAMPAALPLWNHEVTVTTYTLYSSPTGTLDATVEQPAGISKLCLSCHDGSVALDSFSGMSGDTYIDPVYQVGGSGSLAQEHPVSFTYDDDLASADGELHTPSDTDSGLGSTIAVDMLFDDKFECASCHDVHDSAGVPKMLRLTADGSILCLTCHDK